MRTVRLICVICVICVVMLVSLVREGTGQTCGGPAGKLNVNFPEENRILSMDNFHKFVVNRTLHEMYFATPRPRPFVPDVSYKVTLTPMPEPGSFLLENKGVSKGINPECVSFASVLQPASQMDRAIFMYQDSTAVQAYMSGCPSTYIVSVRCTENYDPKRRKCPTEYTYIGIYLLDDVMDDVPFSEIVVELCKATGIKLGNQDMEWFFTFGDNDLCEQT